ncbi:MAG: hypothetical protein Q9163_005716, partial [Psora crenata]
MALILGKRKRRDPPVDDALISSSSSGNLDSAHVQALLKQHFEAKFEPLPATENFSTTVPKSEDGNDHEEAHSAWEGISDGEVDQPELVRYAASTSAKPDLSKDEMKAFMTSRPPMPNVPSTSTAKGRRAPTDGLDDADEAANLKKDLALQRLLRESHLLDPKSALSHSGQNRHKVLDLRLRDMGSKSSIFTQQKMPLAQRKGIAAKTAEREATRRREAQENGIVLEKALPSKRQPDVKRQRGIGAPAVGTFRGGTLRLSKKDVAEIQGTKMMSR